MNCGEEKADWYDGYIEDGEMKVWIISDTHFNHGNIVTYCQRPADFTQIIWRNWTEVVKATDLIIHLGDVGIGNWREFGIEKLPGRKVLIRGNHDRQHSNTWWMEHGFDFACDGMAFRACWLSHEPVDAISDLPIGCTTNVHGHLHNIWHGFTAHGEFSAPPSWRRLFAIEYTKYRPVEFDKFLSHPDKFLARGLVGSEGVPS